MIITGQMMGLETMALMVASSDDTPPDLEPAVDLDPFRLVRGLLDIIAQGGGVERGQGPAQVYGVDHGGEMTRVLHGVEGEDVLEAAFDRLLGADIDRRSITAEQLEQMAAELTRTIFDNLAELAAAVPAGERATIRELADRHGIDERVALTEYLANAFLFRVIRDFHDLQKRDRFSKDDTAGFVIFTRNGSLVSSPPIERPGQERTFHYMKMPSRKTKVKTGSRTSRLEEDITIGARLMSGYHTSAVTLILSIPLDKADLFDQIRRHTEAGSKIVAETSMGLDAVAAEAASPAEERPDRIPTDQLGRWKRFRKLGISDPKPDSED